MMQEAFDKRTDLKALSAREETRPFAAAYTATLDDDDANDFAYLAKDSAGLRLPAEDAEMADADEEGDEDEDEDEEEERRPSKVSVQAQLRELVQRNAEADEEGEPIDIDALVDQEDDDDHTMRVRIVKAVPTRAPVADDEVDFQSRQASFGPTDPRSEQWAMREKRKQGGTGRATTRATIVGNKVKNGGGSLRPGQTATDARQQVEPRKRSLKAAPSILQGAGLSRSSRFES
ncbi:uncharacterized protein SCHCODRAFT_01115418 [Schizophyllum commune H4-8]|uniref:Expressed protein n=1 Tax=Schizophyllum commune (strain H4-8 / FGSC 9210) TaxID=578458 RepID=D8PL10_SCHCM|nr:uncharacterized protein SCHCODRAFT_01115418 [Schizophyllum commune H4-8]KAI5894269.1 hypothetical protein SCHCODRAFT_01115418 [Schizophyllum commune H4-8]